MKSFGKKAWILPQPVLIIGTYDENGKPNAMNAAWAGQWDNHEIMISMGKHQTTENLNGGFCYGRNNGRCRLCWHCKSEERP